MQRHHFCRCTKRVIRHTLGTRAHLCRLRPLWCAAGWKMKRTDLTLRVLQRSLLTRPNGSQSCEVGFSLLELSFFQLLELQSTR